MIRKSLLVAGTMLFAASAWAQTGTSPGASGSSPGHQMNDSTTKSTGKGASKYAPGQKMQELLPSPPYKSSENSDPKNR